MQLQRCMFLLSGLLGLTIFGLDGCGGSSKTTIDESEPEGSNNSGLPKPCFESEDCVVGFCETSRHLCLECVEDGNCGEGSKCVANECEAVDVCESSDQCSGDRSVCDEDGRCVECASDDDCSDQRCVNSKCAEPCENDSDCELSDYCLLPEGGCVPTVCVTDESFCVKGRALTCDSHASVYEEREVCTNGCVDEGEKKGKNVAHCGGEPKETPEKGTGGAGGGGGTGGGVTGTGGTVGSGGTPTPQGGGGNGGSTQPPDGGPTTDASVPETSVSCDAPAAIDSCTKIPRFTGTQVVDGLDTDFCGIPQKVIELSSAGYKNPSDYSGSSSKAVVRLGWSSSALHAFVHVETGAPLSQGDPNLYDGDNVQFFIASDTPSGVQPDGTKDGAANQIYVAPAAGGKPAKHQIQFGSANIEYKVQTVSNGYDVELRWPWPSNLAKPTAANKKIGFDILIGLSKAGGGRAVEYGMYLKQPTGSCSQMYCDDSLWCTPELQP